MTTGWGGERGGEGGERGAGAEDRVQEDWGGRGNRFGPGVGCRLGGEEGWCSGSTVCSVQCTVFSVQCAVLSVQCAVYSVQRLVCSVQCAVCSVQRSVCSV